MKRFMLWSALLGILVLALGGACGAAELDGTKISIAPLVVNGALVPDGVTSAPVIELVGAVTSQVGAKSLHWVNLRGGKGRPILYVGTLGEMELNGKWRIPRIHLKPGRNEIKVTVVPLRGKSVTERIIIHRE
jgi:hypothetical protein